jgi:hypothetical protein
MDKWNADYFDSTAPTTVVNESQLGILAMKP